MFHPGLGPLPIFILTLIPGHPTKSSQLSVMKVVSEGELLEDTKYTTRAGPGFLLLSKNQPLHLTAAFPLQSGGRSVALLQTTCTTNRPLSPLDLHHVSGSVPPCSCQPCPLATFSTHSTCPIVRALCSWAQRVMLAYLEQPMLGEEAMVPLQKGLAGKDTISTVKWAQR